MRNVRRGGRGAQTQALVRGLSPGTRSLKSSNLVNLIMKLPSIQVCIWEKLPSACCVTYRICMTGQAIFSQNSFSLCVEHSISYSQQ